MGLMESETRILGTGKQHLFPTFRYSTASINGLVMRQGYNMFGGGEWNASRYCSFFGEKIVIFGWYTWGAAVQVRSCDVGRYIQRNPLRRPLSFPGVVLENTRNICKRDVQLIE